MKKKFIKVIIFSIIILLIYCTKIYASNDGTVRMQINGDAPWYNVDVSESYKECEDLNSPMSTLGTSALEAHLTTDEDWSAMAIFSVSQYGGSDRNWPVKTTGNDTGIINIGNGYSQTTGISATANKDTDRFISGLFNEDGSLKKYVKRWPATREETNSAAFIGTRGWYSGADIYTSSNGYPVSMKTGLFGYHFGYWYPYNCTGGKFQDVSFRPVIWN